MSADLSLMTTYGPQLLEGFRLTVLIWLFGSALAVALGFVLGLALSVAGPALTLPVRAYVEFFRGTPLLAQLFLAYYGGPSIGITLDAVTVGLCGLGLYGAAYFAEIFRAGFASIPEGQLEAARSFGLSRRSRIRYIILPQMLVFALPSSTNLLIILLKDTAILSIVTVPELTFQVTGMTLETFTFVEPFAALALLYWALTELVAFLGRRAELRLGVYLRPEVRGAE
ncbi:MAG TPA: amino acid ABC transporter permease [Alphaproteobacteria bacterium]|nr:amino acid ABC transporter permease [Alphaproteobacteria bacterium]